MSKRNFPQYDEQYEDRPQAESMGETESSDESNSAPQEEVVSDSEFADSEFEEEKAAFWTREIKIGLAVVFMLVIVLGGLLIKRFTSPGVPEEAKQGTAKADANSPAPTSSKSSGTSAVPKPTVVQGSGSSGRKSPSPEPSSVIPSSWTGSASQEPSGEAQIPPGVAKNTSAFSPSSAVLPSSQGSESPEKTPNRGSRWGLTETAPPSGSNPPTSFAPMISPPGESHLSGSNPLRSSNSSSPASLASKDSNQPLSGNVSGSPLLLTPAMTKSGLQEGASEGNRSLGERVSSAPETSFSPYTPPALGPGITPTGSVQPTTSPYQQGSGAGTPPGGGGMPVAGRMASGSASAGQEPVSGASPTLSQPIGSPQPRFYQVQAGDSYWTISERFYGTGTYYQALAEYNRSRISRPEQLQAGDQLMIPPPEELRRLYPLLCPAPVTTERLGASAGGPSALMPGGGPPPVAPSSGAGAASLQAATPPASSFPASTPRVYIVQEGDTIYEIARFLLGKPSRWVEIYQLNKQVIGEDIEHLRPGTRLVIPPVEPAGSPNPVSIGPSRVFPR
ncbi:MAG: LysM peptidoglycan-binding domain-containing protein [Thermoguttaceae bacterium]|nr:LysM peptidoglycan-binding domain-containing protein [Thermoguttaceae bacterium]MDW8037882.1 LysM peptidoglycan-binding domain-containing protein [Thermoguttaceae bacterium]